MKLNAETKSFRDTLARLSCLPGATTGSPITQVVLFEADMEGLRMTRFSSEAKITVNLESVSITDSDGPFVVNHAAALRFANQLPAKDFTLESDLKYLRLASGRSMAKIAITSTPECDPPEAELETEHIRMPVEQLVRALEFVKPAISTNETQKGLCGVCLRMIDDKLAFIGADGKSLHVFLFDYAMPVDCVIAESSVTAILKTVGERAGACTFSVGASSVSLLSHDSELMAALLNEPFPNIAPMLTQPVTSIKSKIAVSRNEIANAIKATGGIVNDDKFLEFDFDKEEMKVSAINEAESEMVMALDCKATHPGSFSVSAQRIQEAIRTFSEKDEVEIVLYANSILMRESEKIVVIALRHKPASK